MRAGSGHGAARGASQASRGDQNITIGHIWESKEASQTTGGFSTAIGWDLFR